MVRANRLELLLADVSLFRGFSKADLRRVARVAETDTVDAGDVLVREGERGHELYIVVSGAASVRRRGRRIATLGPGDHFGELAVLNPAPRTATVTADEPMEILILGTREFGALLDDVPALARKLLVGMAQRLQEADSSAPT